MLVIDFTQGTSLYRETDRRSDLPISRNGPPGTFVLFPDRIRVSLPTDQLVEAEDSDGHVRVAFGGMAFVRAEGAQLIFHRVRELHAEDQLSPERSHLMLLEQRRVAAVVVNGHRLWPD